MSEYLVLIYGDEDAIEAAGPEVQAEIMTGHEKFGTNHGAAIRGGNALLGKATATTIRKDASGAVTTTDGPFAETKETLGGYYVIEAADLDEALAIAAEIPAPLGSVEVRPVRVFD